MSKFAPAANISFQKFKWIVTLKPVVAEKDPAWHGVQAAGVNAPEFEIILSVQWCSDIFLKFIS